MYALTTQKKPALCNKRTTLIMFVEVDLQTMHIRVSKNMNTTQRAALKNTYTHIFCIHAHTLAHTYLHTRTQAGTGTHILAYMQTRTHAHTYTIRLLSGDIPERNRINVSSYRSSNTPSFLYALGTAPKGIYWNMSKIHKMFKQASVCVSLRLSKYTCVRAHRTISRLGCGNG